MKTCQYYIKKIPTICDAHPVEPKKLVEINEIGKLNYLQAALAKKLQEACYHDGIDPWMLAVVESELRQVGERLAEMRSKIL